MQDTDIIVCDAPSCRMRWTVAELDRYDGLCPACYLPLLVFPNRNVDYFALAPVV